MFWQLWPLAKGSEQRCAGLRDDLDSMTRDPPLSIWTIGVLAAVATGEEVGLALSRICGMPSTVWLVVHLFYLGQRYSGIDSIAHSFCCRSERYGTRSRWRRQSMQGDLEIMPGGPTLSIWDSEVLPVERLAIVSAAGMRCTGNRNR